MKILTRFIFVSAILGMFTACATTITSGTCCDDNTGEEVTETTICEFPEDGRGGGDNAGNITASPAVATD